MGAGPSTPTTAYALQAQFSGANFFNNFNFFSSADPTHGFVTYVDQTTAQNSGLISAQDGKPVYMGVDYKNKYDGTKPYWGINGVGRPSVRIESKQTWTKGLFLIDVVNMPGGACGVWPAFWTLGPDWPNNGEIDIIEGISLNDAANSVLHTGGQCDVPGSNSSQTGQTLSTNCQYAGWNGAGCQVGSNLPLSFGPDFNSNLGGAYAMEWTDSRIRMWFFPRNSIPSDLPTSNPDPSKWGTPFADFTGNCDINSNFKNHQIVLDTTFCGDWAGNPDVWGQSCKAATKSDTCATYVGDNPSAFQNQYWSINYVKVFQLAPVSTTSTTTSTTTTTTSPTTTTTSKTTTTTTTTSPSTTTTSSSTTSKTSTTLSTTTSSSTTKTTTLTTTTTTTRTTTTTSTSPTSTLSPYKYIGCYTDQGDRTLTSNDYTFGNTMTPAQCKSFCTSKSNYKYFGVEAGNQCFCGNTIRSTASVRPEGECNASCAGDASQKCGANGRINIYGQ